jgi:DNA-directed RNA polymerase subunit RPC12/RpoP
MPVSLKAYRCTRCDLEFTVIKLNRDQLTANSTHCPSCGGDQHVSSINCINLSLSERQSEYEIRKSLKPIPGVPVSTSAFSAPVYDTALALIEPEWHETFLKFVETGEAPKEFLSHLAKDEKAQKATEMVFDYQSKGLQALGQALSKKK